jgi:multiple sugar transport system permease protein
MVAPAVLVVLGFGIFPLIYALWVSFHQWEPFSQTHPGNGVANYTEALNDPLFRGAAAKTAMFVAIVVPAQVVIGLGLALIVESRLRLQRLFFPIFLLPLLLAPIVVGYMWLQMWQFPAGIINEILSFVLPGDPRVNWLGSPDTAFITLLVTEIWQWTPFVFVIMLAGLTAVPVPLREAAAVDGAGWWWTFRTVILPAITPVLTVVVVLRMLESANFFATVYSITRGGPGTSTYSLVFYVSKLAQFGRPAVAAASSFIFLIALAIPIGLLLMMFLKRQTAMKRRV